MSKSECPTCDGEGKYWGDCGGQGYHLLACRECGGTGRAYTLARCAGCGREFEARMLIQGKCGECRDAGVVVHKAIDPAGCWITCGEDELGICYGVSSCPDYRA